LDIYKNHLNKEASEKRLVSIGKFTILTAMLLAVVIAPFLGINKKGGFQFIQECTGLVSPGVFAMFIMGFFWKKTTSNAALFAMIGGLLISILFTILPALVDLSFLNPMGFSVPNAQGVYEIPFIDRMGFVFLICTLGMVVISVYETKKGVATNGLEVDASMFKMSRGFTVGTLIILAVLAALYTVFW